MKGPDSISGFSVESTETLTAEYIRLQTAIRQTEKKINEASSNAILLKSWEMQLENLRKKIERTAQKLESSGVDVSKIERKMVENARIGDYPRIKFVSESGNVYTITKQPDGRYAIHNEHRPTVDEYLEAEFIEDATLKIGEKLLLNTGRTTPIKSIEILD